MTSTSQSDLGNPGGPAGATQQDQRRKADRHDDVYRLQGLRGGVPGMERSAVIFGNFEGTYQTQPDLSFNFWNLIKFNETEKEMASRPG